VLSKHLCIAAVFATELCIQLLSYFFAVCVTIIICVNLFSFVGSFFQVADKLLQFNRLHFNLLIFVLYLVRH